MIDVLGYPIKKGDKVLTSGYWSTSLDTLAPVIKVNSKSVIVELPHTIYDAKTQQYAKCIKHIRRELAKVVNVTQQLEYNRKHFPEHSI